MPGVVEELVSHAEGAAGRAKCGSMDGAVHEADEVQDHDGQQEPRHQLGQTLLSDVPREYTCR